MNPRFLIGAIPREVISRMAHTKIANALRSLSLTREECEVIAGCLLGDGTLSKAGKNYRLRVEHQAMHRELVDWKYQKLSRLCLNEPKLVKQHNSYRFGTVGHPELNQWRMECYSANSVKCIPESLVQWISPKSIAIWFMDDGYKIHRTIGIAVHCFSEEDIDRMRSVLGKFEVESQVQQDGHGKRLYVPTQSYEAFEGLVKPTMDEIPCMAYKLRQPCRDYTLAPVKAG